MTKPTVRNIILVFNILGECRESTSQQARHFPPRSLQVQPSTHVFHSTSKALSLSLRAVRISQPFMTKWLRLVMWNCLCVNTDICGDMRFLISHPYWHYANKHGDQKVSVPLMITIQKVTSNVQSVSCQSPDIYWHVELCSRTPCSV